MKSPIIVALDYATEAEALSLVNKLDPQLCRVKVGKELFTACGPSIVSQLNDLGFEVFLDLKFHDIPNTVAQACRAAAALGVWMLNVHASGGRAMLAAARREIDRCEGTKPLLIGVTVLTSLSDSDFSELGVTRNIESQVLHLAGLCREEGLDGVVCSSREAPSLRQNIGEDFCLVTPGIRPEWASGDDQSRIVAPKQALENGSSYLVIGRPITAQENPLTALNKIIDELARD